MGKRNMVQLIGQTVHCMLVVLGCTSYLVVLIRHCVLYKFTYLLTYLY